MSWTPNLSDVNSTTNSGGILIIKARNEFAKRINPKSFTPIRDDRGLIAFETDHHILCAKKAPYGFIVSCHKMLLERAMLTKKQLVMFIEQSDNFYEFDPQRCSNEGTINLRAGQEFTNFDIRWGKNLEKTKEESI